MENLSTNRICLEAIEAYHYNFLKQFAFDKALWKYSTIQINSEEDFKKYFDQALVFSEKTSQRVFIVYDNILEKYIGMTRLYAFDSKNKSTRLGFTWYAPEAQGTGVNSHCKYLVLKYAFEQLNIERIELNADLRNERSIAAMKKMGFVQEGILRQNIILPNGYKRDTIVFSVLKDDWENDIKSHLEHYVINLS